MSNSRFTFLPGDAEYPSANFPEYTTVHSTDRLPVLAYDASTPESAMWTRVIPQGWAGTVTATIKYLMASATSGGVAFDVLVEAVTPGDPRDLDTSTYYDTANTGTDSVPSTAGYMKEVSITLNNLGSASPGDLVRFKITRATANGSDTASGDCCFVAGEVLDGG